MAHKKSIFKTMSSEEFKQLVSESINISEMLRKYGYSSASGTVARIIKDRIINEGIDVSHFKKNDGKGNPKPKYELSEILVENSHYENIGRLKKRLVKAGLLKYECKNCSNKGYWNGKPLVLQLEHKNGKHNDHRLSNLCFLCPNCHSQTETYSGRNADRTKTWIDNL